MEKWYRLFALLVIALLGMTVSYAQNLDFDEEKPAQEEMPVMVVGAGDNETNAINNSMTVFANDVVKVKLQSEYSANKAKIERMLAEPSIVSSYVIIKEKGKYSPSHKKIKVMALFNRDEFIKDLSCDVAEGESAADDEDIAISDAKSKVFMRSVEANLDPRDIRRQESRIKKMRDTKMEEYVQVVKKGSMRYGKIVILARVDIERVKNDLKNMDVSTKNQGMIIIGDTGFLVVVPPYDVNAKVSVNKELLSELTVSALQEKLQKYYQIKNFRTMDEAVSLSRTELAARGVDVRVERDAMNWLFLTEANYIVRVYIDKVEVQKDPAGGEYLVYVSLRLKVTNAISKNTIRVEKSSFNLTLKNTDRNKNERAGGYPTANIGVEQAAREAIKPVARNLAIDLLTTIRDDVHISETKENYFKVTFEGFKDDDTRRAIIRMLRQIEKGENGKEGLWKIHSGPNDSQGTINVDLEYSKGTGLDVYILEKFKPFHLKLAVSGPGRLIFQPRNEEEF